LHYTQPNAKRTPALRGVDAPSIATTSIAEPQIERGAISLKQAQPMSVGKYFLLTKFLCISD